VRLSIINFAGIARTLVAVGTESEASMLCTTRFATPRKGSTRAALGVATCGVGFATTCAGVGVGCVAGRTAGCGVNVSFVTGAGVGAGTGALCCCRFGTGGVPGVDVGVAAPGL